MMRGKDLDRLQEILRLASQLNVADRVAFLKRAEPQRPDLRAEVMSLLEHDTGRGELIAPPLGEPAAIGPYCLVDRLGEAPPARLFRARSRDDPTREVLVVVAGPAPAAARIAAALGDQVQTQRNLDDPCLARLLDAGSTDDGRLYAAFEATEVVPLAELGDALFLTLLERVALIEQVALATDRAHSAGVGPLGLMPWSVLGTWRDGQPAVRLITLDAWPLLALLDPERRAQAGLLACLETSAPEALRGEARGVLTDVFALGALLFEAATGTPPLGLVRIAGRRALREELHSAARITPPLASARVAGLGREAVEVARRRSTVPDALVGELRRGLDSILARALSSDPALRPPSAGAFARELATWRAGRGGGLLKALRAFGGRLVLRLPGRSRPPAEDRSGAPRER